jgi:hypothetical protein
MDLVVEESLLLQRYGGGRHWLTTHAESIHMAHVVGDAWPCGPDCLERNDRHDRENKGARQIA